MQNEDASQAGSMGHAEPIARADVDTLPAGSYGPATGNAITGAGTTTGASGADSVSAPPGTIVEVQGAGGSTSQGAGHFQATGQYGVLTMDQQGDFNYVRNPNTPDGVRDVFHYTLADAAGEHSATTLTIDIGQAAAAAALQGVVTLPAGVELSDIHVNGRDLVINMPDGTQMVIPEGAVFVPQLLIGDVQVPPTNLAALLIDSEPQPAAGSNPSSGGNFADPVPPLDPGVPLGDLIPPTDLNYIPPDFRPIGQFENQKPTVVFEPHDLAPGAVDALDQVAEKGLPARNGNLLNEPAGSGEIADGNGTNNSDDSENTFGQIVFTSGDGLQSITIDGHAITAGSVGTTIQGQFGVMTITSVDLADGTIGYTYKLSDNTSGDNTADHFAVIVTDTSGDTATATLTVDIIDDVPTARSDTDAIVGNDQSTDGNVVTAVGTTSAPGSADTVGADNATVTGALKGTTGTFTGVPQDGSGVTIHGSFGDLVLHDDGSYTYTRSDIHQGGTDVFTYQLTDGDGDTSTATLTITVPQVNTPPEARGSDVAVSEEGLVGGNKDTVGNTDTTDSATASSSIFVHDADGDALTVTLGVPSATLTSGGTPITWALSNGGQTLTGSAGSETIITVTIHNDGTYDVTLAGPIDHAPDSGEQSTGITVPVSVSDGIATTPTSIGISIEDDSPVVNPTVHAAATVTLDETGPAVASTINTDGVVKGDDPDVAGTGNAISKATSGVAIVDANVAFGGDGPAATDSLSYALSITNASSGLTITDGSAISLVMEPNGVIVGVVQGSGAFAGDAAFAISIDPATGVVTVEQYLSIDHPDTTNPNDSLHMLTGSVGVTVTATDADQDSVTSGAVDVSNQITFFDDGPSVAPTLNANATVTLDETGPAVASTISTGLVVKGDDPDVAGTGNAISKATSGSAVVDGHAVFGADGPAITGSLSYGLSITSATSGLMTTDDHAITLEMQNGVIVGVVQGGTFDGEAAFAISINSTTGVVTVEQYLSLDHPINPDPNDPLQMLTGTVGVTVTAKDGDGDSITSGAVDISHQITFLDDGPSVAPTLNTNATVTVDETGPAVASTISTGLVVKGDDPDVAGTGNAISKGTSGSAVVDGHAVFGADGPALTGSLSYGLSITSATSGLTLTDGSAISLQMQNGVIVGVVQGSGTFAGEAAFAISINSTTGVVTVEQYLSLDHPITTDPNDPLQMLTGTIGVTVSATDGDGDKVTSGAVDISHQITFLDDGPTAHADVNSVSEGGSTTGNVETNDLFGADGKDTGGGVTGVEAGSHPTVIVTTGVGQQIPGVFGTLVLNADGTYTYNATPNTNPPPGSTDVFTYTITDGDGDTSTTTLTITVNNVTLPPDDQIKVVNEAALDLNKDGHDLAAGTVTGSNPSSTAETVQGTLNVLGATGYTAEDITGNNGLFHLNADGTYTYTLTSPVDGPATQGTNTVNGVETFTYTAHDADGNTVQGTVTINVIDDVPTAVADVDSVKEDGPLVADGNVLTGSGGSDVNTTDGVADVQGADGATVTGVKLPAAGSFTAVPTGATGTTVIGLHGTLVLHADGTYTYTLNNADTAVQALGQGQTTTDTFNYQITDGDGDLSSTTLTITINGTNDAPVVGSSIANVSEEGLTGANPDTVGSPTDTTNSATATGTVSFTDVDSGDTHTVTLTAPANGSLTSDGFNVIWTGSGTNTLHAFQDVNGNGLVDVGEKAIMTIAIDNTGAYTVTLQGPIDHADPTTEDINSFGVTVNVNDGHVTSTGLLTVNVEDDSPVNFHPVPLTDTTGTPPTQDDALVNDGTASATALINDANNDGTGENFIGSDGFGDLLFTSTGHTDGEQLTDASSNPLTSHGDPIYLFGFGTGELTATTSADNSDPNAVVFTVDLNEGTGFGSNSTYTIDFHDTIDDGSGVVFNNLTSTKAGTTNVYGIGADATGSPDVDAMLTGTSGGVNSTVNTDATSIGIGNQSFNPGDALRIDFVTHMVTDASNTTLGFDYGTHVETNGFQQKVPQVVGQPTTVSFKVWALQTNDTDANLPDSNPTGGFTDSSTVNITEVWVVGHTAGEPQIDPVDITGLANGDTLALAYGISVTRNADGSVTFSGVEQGDSYGIGTGPNQFNAVADQDVTGKFDLGIFALTTTNQGHDINMDFGVTAHDADGDPSTGTIAVTLTAQPVQQAAAINTQTTQVVSQTSLNTSSLVGSNDNGHNGHSTTNNSVMMGALAAAGLSALDAGVNNHLAFSDMAHASASQPMEISTPTSVPGGEANAVDSHFEQAASLMMMQAEEGPTHGAGSTGVHDMVDSARPLATEVTTPAHGTTELLHGTDVSVHAAAQGSPVAAAAITMPSAAQLVAASAQGGVGISVAGDHVQHDQVVAKVLADALHGGAAQGPNIDMLLNSLPGHAGGAGGNAGLETFASQGTGGVSFMHMATAGTFEPFHSMISFEMTMHQDAPPPAHA